MRSPARGAVSLARRAPEANGARMYRCTRPWSDGTTGITLAPLACLEQLAAIVPLPRAHRGRSGGGGAPQSTLRAALMPPPRQPGGDGAAANTGPPSWHWARRRGRVFARARATCPLCRRGARRSIAASTQASVSPRIVRHLTRASVPPPSAPAHRRQELLAVDAAHASVGPEARCAPPRRHSSRCRGAIPFEIVPPQLLPTGRPEALAPGNPCVFSVTPPAPPVQTTRSRARPCGGPLGHGRRGALGSRQSPPARWAAGVMA